MKPNSRKALPASSKLQKIVTGPVVAKIQGSIKKLGQDYQNALLILYNKESFQPIALYRPDENGAYHFFGLNTDVKTFIVAFDQKQQFNAVIQDNVVPK